jgi:AraC family transcriptional regulator
MAQRERNCLFVSTGKRQLATNLQELAMHQNLMGSLSGREGASLADLTLTSNVARSRAAYSGSGFLVEHHRIPKESDEVIAQHHVLMLWTRFTSGEYALGGGRYVPCSKGAGTLTLIPAGVVTALRTYVPTELVLCALESDFVEKLLSEADRHREFAPVMRAKFQDSAIRRLITLLAEELRAGAPTGKLYADSLALAIGMRYARLAEAGHHRERYSHTSALPPIALRRVIERMKHSFETDLTLDSLAAESGYSRAHFLRMFRAATHQTPHQYLLNLRLENAIQKMRERSTPLIDIAVACGFSSHAHFTNVFRSKLGMLPSQYRREL